MTDQIIAYRVKPFYHQVVSYKDQSCREKKSRQICHNIVRADKNKDFKYSHEPSNQSRVGLGPKGKNLTTVEETPITLMVLFYIRQSYLPSGRRCSCQCTHLRVHLRGWTIPQFVTGRSTLLDKLSLQYLSIPSKNTSWLIFNGEPISICIAVTSRHEEKLTTQVIATQLRAIDGIICHWTSSKRKTLKALVRC